MTRRNLLPNKDMSKRLTLSILKGLWIYSLILLAYFVAETIVYPKTATGWLTLYVRIPQDIIAMIVFIVSFLTFVYGSRDSCQRINTQISLSSKEACLNR